MRGIERLRSIEKGTEPLARALPGLPKRETVLVRLIRVAAFGLGDYFADVFHNLGVNETAYHLLAVIYGSENGSNTPSELSELIGTSRANITKTIAKLEGQGYVSRRSGKADARRNIITITESGRNLVDSITDKVAQPIEKGFEGLTAEEKKTFDALLRKAIVSFDSAKTY